MIRPRQHLKYLNREQQNFYDEENFLRLHMNEYVPGISVEFYDKLKHRLTPEILSAYPQVNSAYSKLSQFLNLPCEQLVLTTGSDGVIYSVLQAFCDYGDKIAYISPTYGMYEIYARMLGLDYVELKYTEDLKLKQDDILSVIDSNLKVFLFANPNGVFGNSLDLDFILEIIKRAHQVGTIVLIDEVYADFIDGGISRFARFCETYDNLIIARSFSKSYGVAGIRLGYSISSREARHYLMATRRNVEINSIAVEALKILLDDPAFLKESVANILFSKKKILDYLSQKGFSVYAGEANFLVIETEDECLFKHLQENKILVKRIEYGKRTFLRVTIGVLSYMRNFISAMEKYVGGV